MATIVEASKITFNSISADDPMHESGTILLQMALIESVSHLGDLFDYNDCFRVTPVHSFFWNRLLEMIDILNDESASNVLFNSNRRSRFSIVAFGTSFATSNTLTAPHYLLTHSLTFAPSSLTRWNFTVYL